METFLTIKETARQLGISEGCAYRWARTGKLPTINLGNKGRRPVYRVLKNDLDTFIKERRFSEPCVSL